MTEGQFVLTAVIVASVLLPLIVVGGFSIGVMRRLQRNRAAVVKQWESEGVTFFRGPAGCVFAGVESNERVRGNGLIALTNVDVRIARGVPLAEWRIPYSHIEEVSLEKRFLNKWWHNQLIVIAFTRYDGEVDRIGAHTADNAEWVEAIQQVTRLQSQQMGHATYRRNGR